MVFCKVQKLFKIFTQRSLWEEKEMEKYEKSILPDAAPGVFVN